MSAARTPFVHSRALLYSGFVLTGVVTTVLGPALPVARVALGAF